MKFLKRLHVNIFTFLIIAAGLGVMFRAVNIVTFRNPDAPAISSAAAEGAAAKEDMAPPPEGEPGKSDVQKSVNETVKQLGEGKTEEAGTAAIGHESGHEADKEKAEGEKKAESDMPVNTSDEPRAFTAPEIEVLQSLSKRRDDLDKREQKISAREALLTAAEEEVDRKVGELNKLKAEIEKLLGQQQEQEQARINSLVKIYESMKPKEAATIFNTLDMDVLLAVIGRMKEAKSSPVLAAMDPDKARIVTIKLAEQRQLPGAADAKKPARPMPATPDTTP